MIEIYFGDAKGKTRLCVGAAIQTALKGQNVLLASFCEDYGSYHKLFDMAPHITRLTPQQSLSVRDYFDGAVRTALTLKCSALILDGVFDMTAQNKLSPQEVYEFLSNAPDSLDIICTGNTVDERFLTLADNAVRMTYISEKE